MSVKVPHNEGGFLPAGLVKLTVSESQVPVVVVTCAILNVSKSSLIWQIAENLVDNFYTLVGRENLSKYYCL